MAIQKSVEIKVLNDNQDWVTETVKINKLAVGNWAGFAQVVGRITKALLSDENSNVLDSLAVGVFGEDSGLKFNDDGSVRLMTDGDINKGFLEAALFVFYNATDEFYSLVSTLTDLKPEFIARLDEESLFELLEAVIEVNDFKKVVNLGKNFLEKVTKTYRQKQGLEEKNQA